MGIMLKKTKAQIKIWRSFTLMRLVGLLMAVMIAMMLGKVLVIKWLQIPFMIFVAIVYIILSGRSPTNPQISFWQGLKKWLKFKTSCIVYKECKYEEEKQDTKDTDVANVKQRSFGRNKSRLDANNKDEQHSDSTSA